MPFARRKLRVNEVSLVKRGANQGARITLFKSTNCEGTNQMDVKTIKDEDLRKEVDELIKQHDAKAQADSEKITELEKKLEELIAKSEKPEEKEVEKQEDLPEAVQKRIEDLAKKTQEAEDKANAATEALSKMQSETVAKAIETSLDGLPRTVTEETRETFSGLLKKLEPQDRDNLLAQLQVVEKVAAQAENMYSEVGQPGRSEAGSAEAEIDTLAENLCKEDSKLTLVDARNEVRKTHPELTDRERTEFRDKNPSHYSG